MDFGNVNLPFNVSDMLSTAVGFLRIYSDYIILTLAALAVWIFSGPLVRFADWAGRSIVDYREERASRFTDRESKEYRREMYDYLTKTGRTEERDIWVKKTGNPYE